MKLSKLYTNSDKYFTPIVFNDGLNIVRGKITNFSEKKRDSHNLGKTLLIDVIDFCLLKQLTGSHFTKKLPSECEGLEFYLELSLNNGKYLTIKRKVQNNTRISFKETVEKHQDLTSISDSERDWDIYEQSFEKSKEFLDGKLNLMSIAPFNYRKGISYFLRKQKDYLDVFQVSKFSAGKHVAWKPYIGKILGFSEKVITEKYSCDEEVLDKSKELDTLKSKLTLPDESVDKIRARAEAESELIAKVEAKLDAFDFKEKDLEISESKLQELESDISYINNEIYNLNFDLKEILKSLDSKIMFKIENVKQVFDEVNLHFTESIVKGYEELEEFNKRLTKDRSARLKLEQKRIKNELNELKVKLEQLSEERVKALETIREKDSFKKYKLMQNDLVGSRSKLERLNHDLKIFKILKDKSTELEAVKEKLDKAIKSIEEERDKENETLTSIRSYFRELITDVLKTGGLLYVDLNGENNFEFNANYTQEADPTSPTSEGDGTSYQKLLCVFFDLAVLRFYQSEKFYSFVYHDGVLEGLDDRKKVLLLESIRKYCTDYGIQYVLTVIDSDLPLDDEGNRIEFSEEEVVKVLTDEGEQGRLFKCPIF